MNLNPFKKKENRNCDIGSLLYNCSGGYKANKAMLLSAVYRCVDIISDSVAQLPLEPYFINNDGYKEKYKAHPTYNLLNREPNAKMSRFTLIKTLIVSVLLKGNGYIYIKRDEKGDAKALYFINPDLVTIVQQDDIAKPVVYSVTGLGNVESCNMIHILNFSYDGITGISTLTHARQCLGLAQDSDAHASGFFRGGANLAGILKVESPLTNKQKQDLRSSWQTAFNPSSGTPNGVAVLEGNMSFQPITVNPSDAQLLETRKFNVVDICRFFGVSPTKCFDLTNSSYSTVEATQLAFLTDTLAPLLEKIELEFERKLYKPSEKEHIDVRFDTAVLLRVDKNSQAEYYNKLFYMGVYSSNEIRRELDLPAVEGGDTYCVQSNLMSLENVKNIVPSNKNVSYDTENKQE